MTPIKEILKLFEHHICTWELSERLTREILNSPHQRQRANINRDLSERLECNKRKRRNKDKPTNPSECKKPANSSLGPRPGAVLLKSEIRSPIWRGTISSAFTVPLRLVECFLNISLALLTAFTVESSAFIFALSPSPPHSLVFDLLLSRFLVLSTSSSFCGHEKDYNQSNHATSSPPGDFGCEENTHKKQFHIFLRNM